MDACEGDHARVDGAVHERVARRGGSRCFASLRDDRQANGPCDRQLRHAFEVWHCIRVELKTDLLNSRSREAMVRIGAREEGILRKHMVTYDGRFRDTVYYSVLDTEWPEVRARLESFVNRPD